MKNTKIIHRLQIKRIMRRLLRLTCLAGILLMFTQCATLDHGPTVEETWQMTYDNCRRVLYGYRYVVGNYQGYFPEEYQGLTRTVTFRWTGDRFSIKGIFPDYPEAWINGSVKGDKVYFESTQLLEGTGGERIYFHSGSASYYHKNSNRSISLGMSFEPLEYPEGDYIGYYHEILTNEDRSAITPAHIDDAMSGNAFWLSKNKEPKAEFHTTWQDARVVGTPFPDTNTCIMNMVFRKVSSSGVDDVKPDD